MGLKIRQTPYERTGGPHTGPYQVHPDEVRAQLMVIAMAGSGELPGTFAEEPDPVETDFTIISYDPGNQDLTTSAGRVRTLLKALVDRPNAVKIFGVGPDFFWADGTTLEASAGAAIGDWIFYDTQNCDGDGRWIRGTDGNEVCTTAAGILFHELGHRSLNHPVGTVAEDEMAAVGIENDLREAQGLVPRDPARWYEADCGCPGGCCIVASVSTGSPFSAEVHTLRRVRDELLRGTQIGHHLFDILHEEYYSFSVGVCRIMVLHPGAKRHVEQWFVRPFVRALEMALRYSRQPDDIDSLAGYLHDDSQRGFVLGVGQEEWNKVAEILQFVAEGKTLPRQAVEIDDGTTAIYGLLTQWLPRCPHIKWGIIDLMNIYVEGCARYRSGTDKRALGRWLQAALDRWLGDLPLDHVLHKMSTEELCADLESMASTILIRGPVRRALGERLLRRRKIEPGSAFETRLREAGYLS
jgi:hypothetical protein